MFATAHKPLQDAHLAIGFLDRALQLPAAKRVSYLYQAALVYNAVGRIQDGSRWARAGLDLLVPAPGAPVGIRRKLLAALRPQ